VLIVERLQRALADLAAMPQAAATVHDALTLTSGVRGVSLPI
jgi:hypothetical protein